MASGSRIGRPRRVSGDTLTHLAGVRACRETVHKTLAREGHDRAPCPSRRARMRRWTPVGTAWLRNRLRSPATTLGHRAHQRLERPAAAHGRGLRATARRRRGVGMAHPRTTPRSAPRSRLHIYQLGGREYINTLPVSKPFPSRRLRHRPASFRVVPIGHGKRLDERKAAKSSRLLDALAGAAVMWLGGMSAVSPHPAAAGPGPGASHRPVLVPNARQGVTSSDLPGSHTLVAQQV